jgi:hypothetical protein
MQGCMKATTANGKQTGVRDEGKKLNKPHFVKAKTSQNSTTKHKFNDENSFPSGL